MTYKLTIFNSAKKPKSATVTTSGLVPNWRNKAFPHVEKTPSVIEEADLVGGLDDEDAEGLAPSKGNLRAFENDVSSCDTDICLIYLPTPLCHSLLRSTRVKTRSRMSLH